MTKRDLVEDTKIIRKAEHQEGEKAATSEITEVPVGARARVAAAVRARIRRDQETKDYLTMRYSSRMNKK